MTQVDRRRNRAPRFRISTSPISGLAWPVFFLLVAIITLTSSTVAAQPNSSFSLSISGLKIRATAVDGSPGLTYAWGFGDGASKSGRSASHEYDEPGNYTVTLRVSDSSNNRSISYEDITVKRARSSGRSKVAEEVREEQPPPQLPVPQTCQTLSDGAIKVMTNGAGAQCQIIDGPAGIGNRDIIDAGPILAVDIWGDVGTGAEVCFELSGSITLLDATTSPRRAVTLEIFATDGWTCAQLTGPGTAVLLPGESAVEEDSSAPDGISINVPPGIWNDGSPAVELDDCRVRTRVFTRFRQAPGGDSFGTTIIRYGRTFAARARTDHWFNIVHDDIPGWISAYLVRTDGDCDPRVDSESGETIGD